MKVNVELDGTWYVGEISRIDWCKSLISMAFHYNNPLSWLHFKIRHIEGCSQYQDREYIYVRANQIRFADEFTELIK